MRFLFSFIGAEPNTDWVQSSGIKLDSRASCSPAMTSARGACRSKPAAAACSRSATSAADSVKRVAAAVGDGAQVVAAIHAYLAKAPVHGVASAEPVPVAATVA